MYIYIYIMNIFYIYYYFFIQVNMLFNNTIDVVMSYCVLLEINSW